MSSRSIGRVVFAALLGSIVLAACKKSPDGGEPKKEPAAETSPLELARQNTKPFDPLPEDWATPEQTPAQEDLGRMLFYETRMSKNHDISCNSCHTLTDFGVDGKPKSPGHKGKLGSRNSPTVYNAAGHFTQFWDGRAAAVEEQATGPILNPVEMAMPAETEVLAVLRSIPGYREPFEKAFPDADEPITIDNVAVAIGAFERRLSTPSRWDQFLEGDDEALTQAELEGFNTFVDVGCTACHSGALVGGQMYQKVGAAKPWPNQEDRGRFEVTEEKEDEMKFKVPSLRNIARTAPYFHDGSVAELDQAVETMARHQLARDLSAEETEKIVAWLQTLTGEIDEEFVAQPELPESGEKTPAPDPS